MTVSDIVYEFLSETVFQQHRDMILAFNCSRDGFREGLNKCLHEALKRDVATLIFFDRSSGASERNYPVVGYCSYCCSALRIDDDTFPAVEIVNFAIADKYQDLFFDGQSKKDGWAPCAANILHFCINWIKKEALAKIYAKYIILNAYETKKTVEFYSKNLFSLFPAGYRSFLPRNNYSMFHEI